MKVQISKWWQTNWVEVGFLSLLLLEKDIMSLNETKEIEIVAGNKSRENIKSDRSGLGWQRLILSAAIGQSPSLI